MEIKMPKRYSYTSLSTFDTCPMQWGLKYGAGLYPKEDTLPLALGNCVHKALELAVKGEDPFEILEHGWKGDAKLGLGEEEVLGIPELRMRYFDSWIEPDAKTGATYEACLPNLYAYLEDLLKQPSERFLGSEVEFKINVRGHVIRGSIDSIRLNDEGRIVVCDYKSGRKPYDAKKLASPLQMYTYSLSLKQLFPEYEFGGCEYHHVLVPPPDNIQPIVSKGWEKRCEKKLNKIFDGLEQAAKDGVFKPSPSPLCRWCSFAKDPVNKGQYNGMCPYYSLWTRENQTFEVAEKFVEGTTLEAIVNKKKAKDEDSFIIDF